MFGYVTVNQSEMKYKEFDEYHKYYCGLCKALKERHGVKGQVSLSNDMTFLVVLLTGLYEPEDICGSRRCVAHPMQSHEYIINECTEYVADMNIILTYYKCMDDWQDEKKLLRMLYAKLLLSDRNPLHKTYEEKIKRIISGLSNINNMEKEKTDDIDALSGEFGKIMADICNMKSDEWEKELSGLGYYLGKFIYILDAYDDIENDIKKNSFNPLISRLETADRNAIITEGISQDDRKELFDWCKEVLTMLAAECARYYEMLPIVEHTAILRNILYSGIWTSFYRISEKRGISNPE